MINALSAETGYAAMLKRVRLVLKIAVAHPMSAARAGSVRPTVETAYAPVPRRMKPVLQIATSVLGAGTGYARVQKHVRVVLQIAVIRLYLIVEEAVVHMIEGLMHPI